MSYKRGALYLLDTDTCIHLLKRRQQVRDQAAQVPIGASAISEVTLAELGYGAWSSDRPGENLRLIEDLVESMGLVTLDISPYLTLFAQEKARLRRAGLLIPDFDLLIGVTAVAEQRTLVTGNGRHLGRIQGIALEDWTSPENAVSGAQ